MKKMILLAALLSGAALFAADQAQAVQAPAPAAQSATVVVVAPAPAPQEEEPGIFFCLGRGLCNISTGWLELPRCIVYDNGFLPVFGLIMGIPHGACMTVARELSGVFDIVSFGASGSLCHGKRFPDFVFQDDWIYVRK